jgi:hypothetical protein
MNMPSGSRSTDSVRSARRKDNREGSLAHSASEPDHCDVTRRIAACGVS